MTLFELADSFSGHKTLAVRFTSSSLHALLNETFNLSGQPFWKQVTHIVYHGLHIGLDGEVSVGQPYHYRDNEIAHDSSQVLQSPATFYPLIKSICDMWPHIRMVWSLPPISDNNYLKDALRKNKKEFLNSLKTFIDEYYVDFLEIDLSVLNILSSVNPLLELECGFWVSHHISFQEPLDMAVCPTHVNSLLKNDRLDALILKSYGHLRVSQTPTSHGTYQSMMVYPESSLSDFVILFNWATKFCVPTEKILMDIDTCGVEYLKSKHHPGFVDHFRLLSLNAIYYRKNYGSQTYVEQYNRENGCCTLDFINDNSIVSYDNDQVLHQKLLFIISNNLQGAIIGELHNDTSPLSQYSILQKTADALLSVDEPSL